MNCRCWQPSLNSSITRWKPPVRNWDKSGVLSYGAVSTISHIRIYLITGNKSRICSGNKPEIRNGNQTTVETVVVQLGSKE